MGYMGFGMRKEVYQRKAKKAFEKIKKAYKDDLYQTTNKKTDNRSVDQEAISYEKHPYKPFFETRFYIFTKSILIATFFGALLWYLSLREVYLAYQRDRFEREFHATYGQEMSCYESTFNFLSARPSQLTSITYQQWDDSYHIGLKHPDVVNTSSWHEKLNYLSVYGDSTWFETGKNAELYSDTLIISSGGEIDVFPERWVLTIKNAKPAQLHESVLSFLNTDRVEFMQFAQALRKIKTYSSVQVRRDSLVLGFISEEFDTDYKIVRTSRDLTSSEYGKYTSRLQVGKINKNTYWLRRRDRKDELRWY